MISFERLQMEAKYQYVRAKTAIKVGALGRPLSEDECMVIILEANAWMDDLMENKA